MANKTSKYWQKRFLQLEAAQNQYGQTAYSNIVPAFEQAQRQIQKNIESWYGRYAINNGITLQDARKQLSSSERKELQWSIEQYIKYGQENSIDSRWIKELENASAKYHISRLQALQLQTQQSYEAAYGNELDVVDDMMRNVYQNGYYRTC